MARRHRSAEKVGERSQGERLDARAEQAAGEHEGIESRRRDPLARARGGHLLEEADIECQVVSGDDGAAGESEQAPHRLEGARTLTENLEVVDNVATLEDYRADLGDRSLRGGQATRLEIEHAEPCLGNRHTGEGGRCEPHRPRAQLEPGVLQNCSLEHSSSWAKSPFVLQGQENASGLGNGNRTPLLDLADEPVSGIEPDEHSPMLHEHTFAWARFNRLSGLRSSGCCRR